VLRAEARVKLVNDGRAGGGYEWVQRGAFCQSPYPKATRRISYADGFAAALAQREGASLVTGDPELKELADVVTVEWIGV